MKITLFDQSSTVLDLLPFTFTRPISEIRVGILTIREKWEKWFDAQVGYHTVDYLNRTFKPLNGSNYLIRSNLLPDNNLVSALKGLTPGSGLKDSQNTPIALAYSEEQHELNVDDLLTRTNLFTQPCDFPISTIDNLWDIFQKNGEEIKKDFDLLTNGRTSKAITDPHTVVYKSENIFLEQGADVKAAVLNATDGPIYIGKNGQIQEGAIIKGPFALGDNSVINIGAKIRQNTSTGPHCKLGGEVSNAVLFGYSNKSHDGFLGNSVIGEWCNIGADTNTSNLKNNYSEVKIWNYRLDRFVPTGSQFCGLMMADHGKCAINTMFNTGTVTGVAANIFGSGFPRTSVPSFSWGGAAGYKTYALNKAIESCKTMMARRNCEMTEDEELLLSEVFEMTGKYRIWEKIK